MKVLSELCHAPVPVTQLIDAIARYASTSEEFLEITRRVWPQLQVYHGNTHLRLMPSGKIEDGSIYVEVG